MLESGGLTCSAVTESRDELQMKLNSLAIPLGQAEKNVQRELSAKQAAGTTTATSTRGSAAATSGTASAVRSIELVDVEGRAAEVDTTIKVIDVDLVLLVCMQATQKQLRLNMVSGCACRCGVPLAPGNSVASSVRPEQTEKVVQAVRCRQERQPELPGIPATGAGVHRRGPIAKVWCMPPAAGVAPMLTTPRFPLCRTLLELFDEVRWRAAVASLALTMYVHTRHPQLSKLDGPESGDIVSANAFAYLCAQHGIVAPDDM